MLQELATIRSIIRDRFPAVAKGAVSILEMSYAKHCVEILVRRVPLSRLKFGVNSQSFQTKYLIMGGCSIIRWINESIVVFFRHQWPYSIRHRSEIGIQYPPLEIDPRSSL